MRLHLHAPAKVNLGLRVVGKRADGYHLLDTTFHALDLHDTLTLHDAAEFGLVVTGDGGGLPIPAGDENLVVAAARRFFAAAQVSPQGRIVLDKHIPAGGGLGGGSSDAAATLLLLQHRHGQPLATEDLSALAVGLGADVPFFLRAGTAHGTGIGDVLNPIDDPPVSWFVLVVPPFGTSTAAVFKNYRAELTVSPSSAKPPQGNPASRKGLRVSSGLSTPRWHNDLEVSAEQLYPDLAQLRAVIVGAGFASVSMSGSGSTLFLAFTEREPAAQAHARLHAVMPATVRVLLTRTADGKVGSRVPTADDEVPAAPAPARG
jgi:4-diphosphocytidyl-2-C-methyl-D-erythritol kinase